MRWRLGRGCGYRSGPSLWALITTRLKLLRRGEDFRGATPYARSCAAGGGKEHRLQVRGEGATLIRDARDIEESLAPDGQQQSLFPGLGLGLEAPAVVACREESTYEAPASIDGKALGARRRASSCPRSTPPWRRRSRRARSRCMLSCRARSFRSASTAARSTSCARSSCRGACRRGRSPPRAGHMELR